MIKNLMKYGAAATKARAMYGKLLTPAQWESLLNAEGVKAVWEILRRSPAWDRVGTVAPEPDAMCRALTEQLEDDCRRLGYFLDADDRERLSFFLRYQEQTTPMSPEEYQKWWASAGRSNDGLRRIAGVEADALNLVYILRLRRFPRSAARAREYLIPIRYELKEPLVDRLLKAPTDEVVLSILSGTRWAEAFTSLAPGDLEKQYQHYMEVFCRRILNSADAGAAVVQAFLPIKDMERRKLMRLIGAAAHGADLHAVI